jgi:hypothetical protein
MSVRRLSLMAVLLVLPTILSAQKRGGGSSAGGSKSERNKMTFDTTRVRSSGLLSTKDLEKENMVGFVLDKKKDLKLSDDEVKALKGINDRLKDSVSVAMNSLDSIASRMRRTGDLAPSEGDRQVGRLIASQRVSDVRSQYDVFLKEALTKLSDDHQKAANDLIEARRKELAPDKPGL